jgi:hypothetical protein
MSLGRQQDSRSGPTHADCHLRAPSSPYGARRPDQSPGAHHRRWVRGQRASGAVQVTRCPYRRPEVVVAGCVPLAHARGGDLKQVTTVHSK